MISKKKFAFIARTIGLLAVVAMFVLSATGLLVSIALPQYRTAQRKAKETVLMEDLARIRELLDQYKSDKTTYPPALRDLVDSGYVRKLPVDPFTGRNDTWEEVREDLGQNADANVHSGIIDVKSTAPGSTLEGIPYHDL